MVNRFHREILTQIKKNSGAARDQDKQFPDSYLGSAHLRYAIRSPQLRMIAKTWARDHRDLSAEQLKELLTSLIQAPSFTEKIMAGMISQYCTAEQRKFHPRIFFNWLDHLEGWAEVDAVCTGPFVAKELPAALDQWKPLLLRLSKSKNINKRRASLVLFTSPVRKVNDPELAEIALGIVAKLKHEKEVMITKAISWVLRSMVKHYRKEVERFLDFHEKMLPRIAVRETHTVLETGKK